MAWRGVAWRGVACVRAWAVFFKLAMFAAWHGDKKDLRVELTQAAKEERLAASMRQAIDDNSPSRSVQQLVSTGVATGPTPTQAPRPAPCISKKMRPKNGDMEG